MELRHLRYFVGLAEDLHFARAAARLGISQPPLSQQIRALEAELGVRLFERTSRRVALTAAGKAFLEGARATLERAEQAVSLARRAVLGQEGELGIGFTASAPFVPAIAAAIRTFRDAYPDIRLQLSEAVGAELIAAIKDRLLDVGILRSMAAPPAGSGVRVRHLLSERLVLAMHPAHRLAGQTMVRMADLAGEPLLVHAPERGSGFTETLLALLRDAGIEPRVTQVVREVSSLFGLAAAGIGVTVLAESLSALQTAALVYRPFADETARTALWLLHAELEPTLPCRHFLEIVLAGPG